MEQKTITLVQDSFEKVKPIVSDVAQIFYSKLFECDPALRPLFPNNGEIMKIQSNKFMSMLAYTVAGLSNLDVLIPILQDLGKRHLEYKVEAFHYRIVGEALLKTLEKGLGDDFTPEVKGAWELVYQAISNIMIEASYSKL